MIRNLYKNEQRGKEWAWRIIKKINEVNAIYGAI